jgi:LPXTG-motif cell wall-anchored protein
VSNQRSVLRAVRAAAATGIVACLSVLTLPASPAHGAPEPFSLFADSTTPAVANWEDPAAIELGVKFQSDVDGTVSAVRFYKGDKNTGTHTGSLWTAGGDLIATATFTDETESGWQTVTFDKPVEIVADTTYVASYHTSTGFYSVTLDAFATGPSSGPLHVPGNGAGFLYGAGGFPSNASPHNYFVDVVFHKKPKPTPTEPVPSVSSSTSETAAPTAGATAPPGDGGGGGLPVTGVNAAFLAGAGLVLAATGGLLAWRHRRRTTRFVA